MQEIIDATPNWTLAKDGPRKWTVTGLGETTTYRTKFAAYEAFLIKVAQEARDSYNKEMRTHHQPIDDGKDD